MRERGISDADVERTIASPLRSGRLFDEPEKWEFIGHFDGRVLHVVVYWNGKGTLYKVKTTFWG